jgi:hypothetical protein
MRRIVRTLRKGGTLLHHVPRSPGDGHGRHEEKQVAAHHLWSAHLLRPLLPHLRHEHLAAALFPQGFLPAELHHGFQHPDSLPYRFPIRIAAEAERHAECGIQYAFAADSAHHAGGSRRLVLQARRRSLLAFLRCQVCSLLRSHDFPDS